MTVLDSPLKWHGGKHYLAKKIVQLMPSHLCYCEPYFGGGSVLFAKKPDGISEVVNDLDFRLSNFWRVMQDAEKFKQFARRMQAIPFSECEWKESSMAVSTGPLSCNVDAAVSFFVRSRQSLAGRGTSFAPLSRKRVRRGMNEQASAWITAVEGLPEIHARLKRVVILAREAVKVIRSQDSPNTLFYLDPPYLPDVRNGDQVYAVEMTAEQHISMLDAVLSCKGKFIVSGYPSPLYSERLRGWREVTFDLPNNAASGAEKRRMCETVWMNFDPPAPATEVVADAGT